MEDEIIRVEEQLPGLLIFPSKQRTTFKFTVGGPATHVRVTHNLPSAFQTDIPTTPIMMKTVLHVSSDPLKHANTGFFIKVDTSINGETIEHYINVMILCEQNWKAYNTCEVCGNSFAATQNRLCSIEDSGLFAICEPCHDTNIRPDINYKNMKSSSSEIGLHQNSRTTRVSKPTVSCRMDDHHEADCFCLQCNEDYCFDCFLRQHTGEKMKDHQLINQCEKRWATPKCVVHEDRDATMFCYNPNCQSYMTFVCHSCWTKKHQGCKGGQAATIMKDRVEEMELVLWRLIRINDRFQCSRCIIFHLEEENREQALKHLATFETWRLKLFCKHYGKLYESDLPELASLTDKQLDGLEETIEEFARVIKQKKNLDEGLRLLHQAIIMASTEKVHIAPPLPINKPEDTRKRRQHHQLESRSEKRANRKLEDRGAGKCKNKHTGKCKNNTCRIDNLINPIVSRPFV